MKKVTIWYYAVHQLAMVTQANGLQAYFTTLVLLWVGWRCAAASCDKMQFLVSSPRLTQELASLQVAMV
jgi:hypothetical protein